MDGIHAVVFLVRCTTSLVICETLPTDYLRFSTMEACRGQASALVAVGQASDPDKVWMAKCHYLVDAPVTRDLARQEVPELPRTLVTERLP